MALDYDLLKECIEQDFDPHQKRQPIPKEVKEFIAKRDARCHICGFSRISELNYPHIMIPHHIKPKGEPTPENLITVCMPCHDYIHTMQTRHIKGYNFHRPPKLCI